MDEIKRYWNQIVPHKFWILSGIIFISSGVVFYLTNSSLTELIDTRKKTLDSKFTQIQTISSTASSHPNSFSHLKMEESIKVLEEDVQKAWQVQYDQQKELLVWPKFAFYQDETRETFDKLRPFEKFVKFPIKDDDPAIKKITVNDRNVYRNYIGPEFAELSKIIGTEWKATLGSSAGSGANPYGNMGTGPTAPAGGTSANGESTDIVRWAVSSQQELQNDVVPWYSNGGPPSVLDIYYTQEDLWLTKGIMNIIAAANAGAKQDFEANVKEIEWIRLGKRASRDAGALLGAAGGVVTGGSAGTMGGGGPPQGYGGGSSSAPAGYGGGGMGGGQGGRGDSMLAGARAAAKSDPADGRYVDSTFKPMTGAELRTALEIKDQSQAVKGVAKRIPVRMRLKINPTKISQLVTECGNAKLTLEVYQVRLNTAAAEAGGAGGSGGGSGSKDKPALGGMGSGAGMMSEGPTGPPTDPVSAASETGARLTEVPIEIFGLIYLYNAPAELGNKKPAPAPGAAPANPAAPNAPANTAPANTAPANAAAPANTTTPANAGAPANAAAPNPPATTPPATTPPNTPPAPPPATNPPAGAEPATPPATNPPVAPPDGGEDAAPAPGPDDN